MSVFKVFSSAKTTSRICQIRTYDKGHKNVITATAVPDIAVEMTSIDQLITDQNLSFYEYHMYHTIYDIEYIIVWFGQRECDK